MRGEVSDNKRGALFVSASFSRRSRSRDSFILEGEFRRTACSVKIVQEFETIREYFVGSRAYSLSVSEAVWLWRAQRRRDTHQSKLKRNTCYLKITSL